MFRRHWLGLSAGLLLAALLGGGAGVFVLLSGTYETAATHQHFALTHRLLETGLRLSVARSASHLTAPAAFTAEERLAGAACYRDHCAACHGAPGKPPGSFALGMLPLPTSLVQASRDWETRELFWIVSKGVRMTGMPAWEYRLSAGSRWATVAFLEELPRLDRSAWEYLAAAAPAAACVAAAGPADVAPEQDQPRQPAEVVLRQYGCIGCHRIDGVTGPPLDVGPPLTGWPGRRYIAGTVPNTRANLARVIVDPDGTSPGTLMPDLGVPAAHADLMARFLLEPAR